MEPSMRLLTVLVLAVLAASSAAAAGPPTPPPSAPLFHHVHPHAWQPPGSAIAAGLRAAIDPESGLLTSPPPASADPSLLQAERARTAALARLQTVTRADGSQYIDVRGLLQLYSVVRVGPDGRLHEDCAPTPGEAARVTATPVAPISRAVDR
jgi:hypothetical protein